MHLDEFDRRLLNALQQDNQQTGEQLADQVGLSAAACLRRAQKLRENGAIEREVAILSPEVVGRRLTVIVLVTLERHETLGNESFRKRMLADEAVTQCYSVTGSADYVVILSVVDMEAYEDFTQLYFYDRSIKRFESLASLTKVKFTTAVPL